MPISDQEGYEKGHFLRVYKHLIVPACERAGFKPIRADDEVKTNYIVIDIIRKILDSDIVLADLSAKNPNVMYELGVRQAFNKKTMLIKDNRTSRVFDIQGLRTIDYDESLRIDEVQNKIDKISNALKETFKSGDDEINSVLQLLSIKPASYPESFELSKESNLVLNALEGISNRLTKIEWEKPIFYRTEKSTFRVNGESFELGQEMYDSGSSFDSIGKLIWVDGSIIYYSDNENKIKSINKENDIYSRISSLPF